MSKNVLLKALILFFVCMNVTYAQSLGVIYPFDDAEKDIDFGNFVSKLKFALVNKDVSFVQDIIDDDIQFPFGIESGKSMFLQEWQLENSKSELWSLLLSLINLGFVKNNEQGIIGFNFPYYWGHSVFNNPVIECNGIVVIKPDVNVYERPDYNSKIIATSNFDVFLEKERNDNFTRIQFTRTKIGFIQNDALRNICDYRGGFVKKSGKWKLVWFIAGD